MGVAVDAFGSFFLCERFAGIRGVGAAEGVDGTIWRGGGCAAPGLAAARASASERWLEKVFWDWRILRTAGVTLP